MLPHKVEKSQEQLELEDILKQTGSKSSSSSAPQAISHMEDKNKTTRKRGPRIEPFRFKLQQDPAYAARACKTVTQAICEFYAQGRSTSTPHEQLCRESYMLVLHKRGEDLYSAVETTLNSEVQSLCRPLSLWTSGDGALFLQELLAKWNQHITAVDFTRDIVMYMDRTYVPTNRKTPIKELGLRLWREHMVRTEIRERLVKAVLKRQGEGGGEDELVAGVNKMLTELGEEVPRLFFPEGELHVPAPK